MTECRILLKVSPRYQLMECKGRVAWIVPTRQDLRQTAKKKYDVGIEFIDMTSEMRQKLKKILDVKAAI